MMERIIRFSIRNKPVIGFLVLGIIIWGIYALRQLPVDAVPDITNNQVQIITRAPNLACQEIEQFITYPVEQRIANLPDLEEIRSVSRFGLSVITVVFKDHVNIYFGRQLILEQLAEVTDEMPPDAGRPHLAPVSTGLGEVLQYVIRPAEGSEGRYSLADLRTMQDWIVARQLYGTPGVSEVNSIGGMVRQYEVAVDPVRLKAMQVTIPEILEALQKNNQNTGGAYIDRRPNAYFIRGIGLLTSLEDVGKIVVKSREGIPVLVRDVAELKFGHAVRYGAATRNGETETVGGIVMMLKGSNSARVVKDVRAKLDIIQQSLPEDVVIEPFLDRTSLVDRAIRTVKTNLVEGALIVIFVLVVFLGNLRAGLIVASAIPLSMLFAFGMMHTFGVSANLMSLGAIDFGLIVDGAVIIVEATMHHLGLRKSTHKLTRAEMDEEVFVSASKIRHSAAFGEIIILMVYIPILTLVGIEGKMFRPMAQTVSFAIIGALILSFTYIPVASALFLSRKPHLRKTVSDKMIGWLQRRYAPVLNWALRSRRTVVAAALGFLIVCGALFSRMGGEFIPQLQEGDFAFHCILPQGASLEQSIETSKQASRILLEFPEVREVVGRTGSAEIPTDPMPPEATDLIVLLKEQSEWTTTKDPSELARLMLERLEAIPGVFFEASQPIQMRFNELMTGVRQDVAVKIFGENLDTLAAIAPQIAGLAGSVKGITTPQVERTSGLPQITITYDRDRIAAYGLDIATVNQVVSTAFAGQPAGVIFENERKFDLVVRLDEAFRRSIDDVAGLYIPTGNGTQVPLSQLAEISYREGPAQISREQARRKVVVGFNVSGRDVQSVVREVQELIGARISLPPGYFITYGGTFENLEHATARLQIAVPVALLLILILLYFTFRSIRHALLIFTAIPLAAIGGVLALWLRGMPFSISAGVGFIALFGVAVLNGIVLVSTFNQLAREGVTDLYERVREGCRIRLRPVLMTATVASLGFLPMALSRGAGAEVQKPLATVVIGGLITATLLTLLVLPVLYILFERKVRVPVTAKSLSLLALLLSLFLPGVRAQEISQRLSFDSLYIRAVSGSLGLKSSGIALSRAEALRHSSFSVPKTGLFVENEDLTPADRLGILKIGVSQSLEWPGIYAARNRMLQGQAQVAGYVLETQQLELERQLREAYYTLWYHQSRMELWQQLDSIYTSLYQAASLRVRAGESAGLDSIAARTSSAEVRIRLSMLRQDIAMEQARIRTLTNESEAILPEAGPLPKLEIPADTGHLDRHPFLMQHAGEISVAAAGLKLERRSLLPDLSGRFFSQRLYGMSNPFTGFNVSVGVPLLGIGSHRARIRAATLEREYRQTLYQWQEQQLSTAKEQAGRNLKQELELLGYYEREGLRQAAAIIDAANLSYRAGEISFTGLSQFITQAIDIRKNYLDALHQYNMAAIALLYYDRPADR